MRKRYRQINGELVEYGQAISAERAGPDILPDIAPYQSMLTGEMITSRSRHREHLKEHGAIELGNDSSLTKPRTGIPDVAPQQRKELIRAQINEMTNAQFERARKKDLDNLRWNSRQD